MLAMADRNGYVGASVPGLSGRARVALEATEAALNTLLAPDTYSRSQEFEGRRIEVADRGWVILNYDRFRDMRDEEARREYERNRKREARARGRVPDSPDLSDNVPDNYDLSHDVPDMSRTNTPENAVTDANVPDSPTNVPQCLPQSAQAHTEVQEEVRTKDRVCVGAHAPIHDNGHRKHAHCGRICLPAWLFTEFMGRRNHDNADQELRAWAMTVESEWGPGGPKARVETGDALEFWRTRYSEKWPTPQTASSNKSFSKTAGNAAALQRFVDRGRQ